MKPLRRGRLSPREQRERVNATHRFYAAGISDPEKRAAYEAKFILELPPKAHRIRRTSDEKPALPLEKHVLAAALEALRHDPRVAFADRQQSGVFQDGDRFIRVGSPGKLDIVGMLKGGRYMELEAKRPGEKPDERQALRIAFVRQHGGVSGYFTSADEALALLP